jgi:HAD superfamily hydrolase (TIGR01509 family)
MTRRRVSRALLLDKDGPIVPLEPTWSTWAVVVLDRLGQLAPRQDLAAALGVHPGTGSVEPDGLLAVGTVAAVAAALASVVGSARERPIEETGTLVQRGMAAADAATSGLRLMPTRGMTSLLAACRAEAVPVALVTNDDRANTLRQLEALGLRTHIDVVVCADDGPEPKPSGAMLTAACALLEVAPSDAVMVGDTIVDLLAAADAGTGFALLRERRPGWLPDAAAIIRSPLEIARILGLREHG